MALCNYTAYSNVQNIIIFDQEWLNMGHFMQVPRFALSLSLTQTGLYKIDFSINKWLVFTNKPKQKWTM